MQLVGLGLVLLLLVAADAPQALMTARSSIFLIREGEVVPESLYVAASVARVAGTIEGDLIVLASDHLEVTGRVEGDIIGFATTARIGGVVEGSIRLAGVDLEVVGEVGQDVVTVGRELAMAGSVERDLLAWAVSLDMDGKVGHDLGGRTFGGADISGVVGRDVEMSVGRMTVRPEARIGGDLGYRSSSEGRIDPAASVGGTVVRRFPASLDFRVGAVRLLAVTVAFLLMVAYGILRIRIWPDRVVDSIGYLRRHPLKSLLRGFGYLVVLQLPWVIPLLGVAFGSARIALVTLVVGPALAVALIPVVVAGVVAGPVPVLIEFGRFLGLGAAKPYRALLVSAFLLFLVVLLGLVGVPLALLVFCLGTGSAWRRRPREDPPGEQPPPVHRGWRGPSSWRL